MPTYEYVCDACGHEFEEFESIKAAPQRICPQCKEEKLRRKIGAGAAILFKGSGFYQTDYRSSSYKEKAKADKPPESGAKSGESSSSSTTAPKSDSSPKPASGSNGASP
jgi:putative FmdB family regulatory protein